SELEALQEEAPGLIEAIAAAREDKDFRENAPLDAAREALAQNESRRRKLKDEIRRARIVSDETGDRAGLGSSVTITRLDNGQKATYQLVGVREANVREGKISIESPVGRGLLGRAVGEEATVSTPTGEVLFRVDDIDASGN
ncbi:MAG: GreA/GreB family elongation factor, partial [Dehalococcoidia bacterium]